MIALKVSYDPDLERAELDCHWWAGLALSAEEKMAIEDPIELERLADANPQRASSRSAVRRLLDGEILNEEGSSFSFQNVRLL